MMYSSPLRPQGPSSGDIALNDVITIQCQVRIKAISDGISQFNEMQIMTCSMCRWNDELASEADQRSNGRIIDENGIKMKAYNMKSGKGAYGPELIFKSVQELSRSGSLSSSVHGRRCRELDKSNSSLNNSLHIQQMSHLLKLPPSKKVDSPFDLSNTTSRRTQSPDPKKTNQINLRAQSPDPTRGGSRRRNESLTPSRNYSPSVRASALFSVKNDGCNKSEEGVVEPFALPLQIIVNAEKISCSDDSTDVKEKRKINLTTKHNGYFEIRFSSKHAQDILFAFLTANLPQENINCIQLDDAHKIKENNVEKNISADMDNFQARAVTGRFHNETFSEKMRRRMARFAARIDDTVITEGRWVCGPCGKAKVSDEPTSKYISPNILDIEDFDDNIIGLETLSLEEKESLVNQELIMNFTQSAGISSKSDLLQALKEEDLTQLAQHNNHESKGSHQTVDI